MSGASGVKSMNLHLKGQIKYLNDSLGNMKVDHDLQLEKLRKEKDQDGSTHYVELDKKENQINSLNEEIDKLKVELEMLQDDLNVKTEEVEELQADLEIKETGFNNRSVNCCACVCLLKACDHFQLFSYLQLQRE